MLERERIGFQRYNDINMSLYFLDDFGWAHSLGSRSWDVSPWAKRERRTIVDAMRVPEL